MCALCVVAVLFGFGRSATEAVEKYDVESIVRDATHCAKLALNHVVRLACYICPIALTGGKQ